MRSDDDDFFSGKRVWSVIKDEVLGAYMPAYLAKVKLLRRGILLIDGYAGPGVFEDGTTGSPIIMCEAAEKYVPDGYHAYFFNKEAKYHDALVRALADKGFSSHATPILGDSNQLLQTIVGELGDKTVFLYLDPFGLRGCEFNLLTPFLTRPTWYSTEIVLTLSMPILHRLAAHKAVEKGRTGDPLIASFHGRLTRVFGGEYWKDIMWSDKTAKEKEWELLEAYTQKLHDYLPYAGFCPVSLNEDSRTKYFIVFVSRHPDAMLLMNDNMANAYHGHMHKQRYHGTLFETSNWREMRIVDDLRAVQDLDDVILKVVEDFPNATRLELWTKIVQDNFMRYTSSEYKDAVQSLVDERKLVCTAGRKVKRLNNTCQLKLPDSD